MPKSSESGSPSRPAARSAKAARMTQAERSRLTRQRVCEATLETLTEVGHERISTSMIAQKARVSRGALTHQFPTRNDLLVAALRHLHDIWGESYPFGADPATTHFSPVDLVDALWDNVFSYKHYIASLELMLAARLDTNLGRGLRNEMKTWLTRRDHQVALLMGFEPGSEQETLYLHLTLSLLRGIAVHRTFDPDETMAPQLVELWKSIVRQVMPASGDQPPAKCFNQAG